jgi:hypothetical protein
MCRVRQPLSRKRFVLRAASPDAPLQCLAPQLYADLAIETPDQLRVYAPAFTTQQHVGSPVSEANRLSARSKIARLDVITTWIVPAAQAWSMSPDFQPDPSCVRSWLGLDPMMDGVSWKKCIRPA